MIVRTKVGDELLSLICAYLTIKSTYFYNKHLFGYYLFDIIYSVINSVINKE